MRRTLTAQRPASPTWGSRIILLGAAALIAASAYALYYQVDTSLIWLNGIITTNRKLGIPVVEYLWTMLQSDIRLRRLLSQMLFLLALVIISLVAIRTRKHTRACVIMIPILAFCYWAGCALDLYSTDPSSLLRFLYALPLLIIAVGCVLQIVHTLQLSHAKPQYQRPATPHRPGRFAPPTVKRTVPEKPRQYRDAPGATRMVPPATQQPVVQQHSAQTRSPGQRLEQPVPDRAATHIGQSTVKPEEKPRYQWKTIKKNDRNDVIGQ